MSQEVSLALEKCGDSARVAWTAFLILLVGHATVDALAALVPATLGLLEVRVGLTAQQSAWLLGLGPLCSGLSQPACAVLSDRQNTRRWGVVGVALGGLGICSLGLVGNMTSLALVYAMGMIGIGMFHPMAATTIGHLKQHKRNSAVSLFFVCGMLGGVTGAYCWPRFLTTAGGFQNLPWIMLPVFALVVVMQRSSAQLAPLHDSSVVAPVKSTPRADWAMVGLLYLAACLRFCVNLALFYLYVRWVQAAYATEHASWTPMEVAKSAAPVVGDLNAATLLGMALGGLTAGVFVRVGREKIPMVLVPITFAPVIAAFPYAPLSLGYVLAAMAGVGFAAMIPITIALAQQLLPRRANLASSLMMGGAWAMAMLGPLLAEIAVSQWGVSTTFLLTAACLVVSGIVCLPLPRRVSQDGSPLQGDP